MNKINKNDDNIYPIYSVYQDKRFLAILFSTNPLMIVPPQQTPLFLDLQRDRKPQLGDSTLHNPQ